MENLFELDAIGAPTKQNKSSAVMQQRTEPRDSLDDFPTPSWAVRAVIEHVIKPRFWTLDTMSVLEPTCNRGFMSEPCREYFGRVVSSDIKDYGYQHMDYVADFLSDKPIENYDWVFMNPPFTLAEQFIKRSLEVANGGVACIVRSAFTEGVGRYNRLFKDNPPTIIAQHVERVPMVKGRYDPKASTATAYVWLIWIKGAIREPNIWIPPSKVSLYRTGDEVPKIRVDYVPEDEQTDGPENEKIENMNGDNPA